MQPQNPYQLSDEELVAEVRRLAGSERRATVALIEHLAELDRRRLYLGAGFSSMFTYCQNVLRLSEHAAYHRIAAARASRRFPALLGALSNGSLNLTSVRLLGPYLTEHNHAELIEVASGKTRNAVEVLLARRFPKPDVAASIRKLPAARRSAEPDPPTFGLQNGLETAPMTPAESASPPGSPPVAVVPAINVPTPQPMASSTSPPDPSVFTRPKPVVTALSTDRYQVTFTATAETREKLELARDLLRHAIPTGEVGAIVDRALTLLLEDVARKRFAATERPRPSRELVLGSRHSPASVKREVWVRDLGRCAFVSPDGRRCSERGFLEFHHVHPYADGGPTTVENIRLACRAHNAYEADLFFGLRADGYVQEPMACYG